MKLLNQKRGQTNKNSCRVTKLASKTLIGSLKICCKLHKYVIKEIFSILGSYYRNHHVNQRHCEIKKKLFNPFPCARVILTGQLEVACFFIYHI